LIRVLQNSNEIAEYTYNGSGQRIKKVTQTETRIFHYDLLGHLIAETNQSAQMLVEYVYLGDQLLAMIKPGEVAYYFHNDHLGTPQVLTNESQTVAWKAVYTPFGEAVTSIETVENPFRFPGQYYDTETGLHYNYFRYYDPMTGRYITPDPIGLEGGINPFAYVANNPINWVDPWGLDPIDRSTGRDNPILRCHFATHNDPRENLFGALIISGVVTTAILGPEVPIFARNMYNWLYITFLGNHQLYQYSLDFILGTTPTPPPPSWGGYAGGGASWAYGQLKPYLDYHWPPSAIPPYLLPSH
jgi:RHS repeat-associated protein